MILNIVLGAVGLALLIICADVLVSGAASFAKNLKIPALVVGLTVIAFGSSAPELAISFGSHLSGNTDILFGNVIGSSISNILFILGAAVLIVPFKIENDIIKKQIPILLLVTMGLSVLFLDSIFSPGPQNALTRADGVILILFFSIFIYYLITVLARRKDGGEPDGPPKHKMLKSVIFMILGLGGVIGGSELLVSNAASLAESLGVSQKIISVTIISVGTSLPELVTTVTAARKGENNMAIGNIVGSNIFNICIVLGLPVIILGEAATLAFNFIDVIFMISSVVLLWIFTATGRKIRRYEGAILVAAYGGYIAYILL